MTDVPRQEVVINTSDTDNFRLLFGDFPPSHYFPGYANFRTTQRDQKGFLLSVKNTSLPAISIDEEKRPIPTSLVTDFVGHLDFSPLSIEFAVDEYHRNYSLMLYWLYMKEFPEGLSGIVPESSKEEVFTNATLFFLDNHMKKAAEYTFTDLHPNSLSELRADYTESEAILCTVEFGYSYFIPSDTYKVTVSD